MKLQIKEFSCTGTTQDRRKNRRKNRKKKSDTENINAENITEELIESQIDDVEKKTRRVHVDTSKPFHMNIQNGTSRKRRRSIFRRRKKKKQRNRDPS